MPERIVRGIREAARVSCKGLSKACIHEENELKTCPMKLRQYIYKRFGNYENVQGGPCKCNRNGTEGSRSN